MYCSTEVHAIPDGLPVHTMPKMGVNKHHIKVINGLPVDASEVRSHCEPILNKVHGSGARGGHLVTIPGE